MKKQQHRTGYEVQAAGDAWWHRTLDGAWRRASRIQWTQTVIWDCATGDRVRVLGCGCPTSRRASYAARAGDAARAPTPFSEARREIERRSAETFGVGGDGWTTIIVRADSDADDCLAAAVERYIDEHPEAEGWDLRPRWVDDDDRELVALTVPGLVVVR